MLSYEASSGVFGVGGWGGGGVGGGGGGGGGWRDIVLQQTPVNWSVAQFIDTIDSSYITIH